MSRKKWITAHIDKELAALVAESHSLDPFTALMIIVPLSTREPRTAGDMSVAFLQNSEEPDIPRRWI